MRARPSSRTRPRFSRRRFSPQLEEMERFAERVIPLVKEASRRGAAV